MGFTILLLKQGSSLSSIAHSVRNLLVHFQFIINTFKVEPKIAIPGFHSIPKPAPYPQVVFTTWGMPAWIGSVPLHDVGWCVPDLPYFFDRGIYCSFYRNSCYLCHYYSFF